MNRIYVIFFLFVGLQLSAQVPVVRTHATLDLGEPRLTTVFQDRHGWIWLGAQNGLFRYDGQEYMPINFPENFEPSPVSALFESNNQLWAGFQNGAIAYLPIVSGKAPLTTGDIEEDRRKAPHLTLWQPEEGLPKAKISGIAEDGIGGLWFATYGEGVYVWKEGRLYLFNQEDEGITSNDIYAIVSDKKGNVWLASDAGISICAMPEKGIKKVRTLTKANGLPDEIITSLAIDIQGNIWGGTDEKGVFRINAAQNAIDFSTPNWNAGPVTSLSVYGNSEIWVGTDKTGLVQINGETGSVLTMPTEHPLSGVNIRAMYKDREGLLWMIYNNGQLCSSNIRFGMVNTPFSYIQAICSDAQGRLWIGSREGLFMQTAGGFSKILPKAENIVSLWLSPNDGKIWVGSLGHGVFIVNPNGRIESHLEENKALVNGSVLSISGNSERVWLATLGGVTAINAHTLMPEIGNHSEALGSNYVYKVFTDSHGRVWFGTDGKGLAVFDKGNFKTFTEANGIPLRTIYSIAEDKSGNIWFSTDRDGLFRFDGANFKRFTTANHLHSMSITGLAADGNNRLVIGYEDGFDVLNPGRLDHVTFCGAKNGAPQIDVNLNALWTDAKGNVWLGARNGMVRAAAFKEPVLEDPQPSITGVSVFLQSIDFLQNTTFSYDQNYFIFNFIGLWYSNPEMVRYRYRLEGFDPEWKVSKDHSASYPKLPPGNYTFRVQTSEHGNFDNVPETSWSFTIEKPYWQRWWFIVLSGALLAGLLLTYVRLRETRLKREAMLKRETVESQFETLKSQINPHFLFNSFNTLITIIEENPKIAVEYVEHLSDFYRSIVVYRERDLISVGEEMELVHSFDFLLKKRYEDGFHLVSKVNGQPGQVMPLSLQMLVENAVKHNIISASKPLTVELFTENGYIVVRNNIQKKIKPEASTHFGLQSLIHRYKLLGERPIVVEENEAFFIVKIPIIT